MADGARYASRVVLPHAPRVVVLYPGENDLRARDDAGGLGEGFRTFYKADSNGSSEDAHCRHRTEAHAAPLAAPRRMHD